jgi:uncharacterized CHY-type Zn-finger protein
MYKHVNVNNFTDSWADGLAFCALLHSFHPDLITYDTLNPDNKAENLKLGFDVAEKLGIPRLLEPDDMLIATGPDKFSVITYLSQFFHHFKGASNEQININLGPDSKHDDEAIRKRKEQMEADLKKRAKKCSKCSEPLSGTAIEALGTTWHQKCFVCFACDKPFQDNKFINVENKPYCQPCGKKAFKAKTQPKDSTSNPPCAKCGELCENETVEALKQSWHVKCFVCTMCSKSFGNNKFINVDSKPYCEQCGRKAFVSGRMQRRNSTADLKKAAETPAEPDDDTPPTPTPAPTPAKAKVGSPLINSGGQVPTVSGMMRSQSASFQKPAQVVPESTKDAESYRPKLAATGGGMADRLAAFQKKPDETAKPATSPSGPARDVTRAKSAIFEKKPGDADEAKKKLEAKKKEEEELERIREEKKKQRLVEEEKRKKEKEQEENLRKEQEAQEKAKREEGRKKREDERKKKEEEEEAAEQARQTERKKKEDAKKQQLAEEEEAERKREEEKKRKEEERKQQLAAEEARKLEEAKQALARQVEDEARQIREKADKEREERRKQLEKEAQEEDEKLKRELEERKRKREEARKKIEEDEERERLAAEERKKERERCPTTIHYVPYARQGLYSSLRGAMVTALKDL